MFHSLHLYYDIYNDLKLEERILEFKIRTLALLLCVCTILSSSSAFALEINSNSFLKAEKETRKQIIFTKQIAIMEQNHLQFHEEEGAISLSISEVKDVYDFAGNKYTLAELKPQGYFLFHDKSGTFAEYSTRTLSPYLGLFDALYYAGVKEYYTKDQTGQRSLNSNMEYKHSVIGYRIK